MALYPPEPDYEQRVEAFRKEIPTFDVKRRKINGGQQVLIVTCPRPDCRNWFMVGLYWCRLQSKPEQLRRRPCPHCWRTAKVPKLPRVIL
jgi:hypothetical protein